MGACCAARRAYVVRRRPPASSGGRTRTPKGSTRSCCVTDFTTPEEWNSHLTRAPPSDAHRLAGVAGVSVDQFGEPAVADDPTQRDRPGLPRELGDRRSVHVD